MSYRAIRCNTARPLHWTSKFSSRPCFSLIQPPAMVARSRCLATATASSPLGENDFLRLDTSKHAGCQTTPPTFTLPGEVICDHAGISMGKSMIGAWQRHGIFHLALTPAQSEVMQAAYQASREFFKLPGEVKATYIDDQSYAGYIASGEEITDGIADYSETFTVTKDLHNSDNRVRERWPCHGPCPWPSESYKGAMKNVMDQLGALGDKLLLLTVLGLGLQNEKTLLNLTEDGWHHLRALRAPANQTTNGKGKDGRGIGAHTDYGLLVLLSQDEVGGLHVRPPQDEEKLRNWEASAAGKNEDDDKWVFVCPQENTLAVFPGDMMQYITSDHLTATPHKVLLSNRERFSFAYFHEPGFTKTIRRLDKYESDGGIHYGTHFTNMFLRNYPDRVTTKRMYEENRLDVLRDLARYDDQSRPLYHE